MLAHRITCIEIGERIFTIECTCGWISWTPWGEPGATKAAEEHIIKARLRLT
jgi:hypothetical protein